MAATEPRIEIGAHDTGDRLAAPRGNTALQVAGALAQLAPEVDKALGAVATKMQADAAAKAQTDALKNAGAAFGDAVRDGRLKPTQNPWYIKAYNEESAHIRGQTSLQQLAVDSQSWASRNDPTAFAQEWNTKVGALAGNFKDTDSATGFMRANSQVSSQILNQNMAQNADRIVTERKQNVSALAASAIQTVVQANGGQAPADKVWAALKPLHDQWSSTGGSDTEWNTLAAQSVTSAAYALQNPGILDVLKEPEVGAAPGLVAPAAITAEPLPPVDGQAPAAAPATVTFEGAPQEVPAVVTKAGSRAVGETVPLSGKPMEIAQAALGKLFGGKAVITSNYRSAAHNAAVGGAPHSDHLTGRAFDIVVPGVPMAEVKARLLAAGVPHRIIINEGDHVHWSLPKAGGGSMTLAAATQAATGMPTTTPSQPVEIPANVPGQPPGQAAPGRVIGAKPGSIYSIGGVADAVETDRYRIQSAIDSKGESLIHARQDAIRLEGMKAQDAAFTAWGTGLLSGQVKPDDVIAGLTKAGYTPQAIGYALNSVNGMVSDNLSLQKARTGLMQRDPTVAKEVMGMAVEAAQKGYTPDLEHRATDAMLAGHMDTDDAIRLVDASLARSHQQASDARAEAKAEVAAKKADEAERPGLHIKSTASATQDASNLGDVVASQLTTMGVRISADRRKQYKQRTEDAAKAYLASHPGDYAGAVLAARSQAAAMINAAASDVERSRTQAAGQQPGRPVTSSSANPRR